MGLVNVYRDANMLYGKREPIALPAVMMAIMAAGGCRSPGDYRREADRVAYDVITRKQAEALGRTEPFTIETPAETLRRRLLLDQHLPFAAEASLGAGALEPIKEWPHDDYLEKQAVEDPLVAVVVIRKIDRCGVHDVAGVVPRQQQIGGGHLGVVGRVARFGHRVAEVEDIVGGQAQIGGQDRHLQPLAADGTVARIPANFAP